MASDVEKRGGGSLRVGEGAVLVVVAVVGVVVAFSILHFIFGAFADIIKIVVLVAIVGGVFHLLRRRRT